MSSDGGQNSESSNIYQAGRDLLVAIADRKKLREHFGWLLEQADGQVNALAPDGFVSPTAEGSRQAFSSEHLVRSIAKAGIPIQVGLDVLEVLHGYLEPILANSPDPPSTSHLRRAVLDALYGLASVYPPSVAASWADVYARRWGNPYERLTVLERDGAEHNLDYLYLLGTIIPHLTRNVFGVPYETLTSTEFISRTMARNMAEQILDHVKSLNVYTIRYKTLYNLAYDLATQPPHPWFVSEKTRVATVRYDLERAAYHDRNIDEQILQPDKGPARHSLREAMNHACSSILGHYQAFLGASPLGSLAQLAHLLRMGSSEDHRILWEFSSINQIDGDLQSAGLTRSDFLLELERLQHNLSVHDSKLPVVARQVHRLVSTAMTLCEPTAQEPDARWNSDDLEQLLRVVQNAFSRIDGLKYVRRDGDDLWYRSTLQGDIFKGVGSELLVRPLYTSVENATRMASEVDATITRCSDVLERNPLANTAILVACPRATHNCKVVAANRSSRDKLYFLLDGAEVERVIADRNRLEKLLELLHDSMSMRSISPTPPVR